MACKASTGIENSANCDEILLVGGVDKTFWAGYLSELDTQISLAQTAPIRNIDFGSYGGLRRFDGRKFSHTFTQSLQVAPGGNKSWTQTFVAKVIANDYADDVVLQDLAKGDDIFIVFRDNNRKFRIVGAGNGLSVTADENTTGQDSAADVSDTITLTGSETTRALYLELEAGFQATLDYLESMEL